MSHCRSASGSAFGERGPCGRAALAPPTRPSASARSNFLVRSVVVSVLGTEPMTRFFAVPWIAAWPSASASNRELDDLTVATPTSVFSLTMVPPDAAMARCAVSTDVPSA